MERKLDKSEKILLAVFGGMAVVCITLLIPAVQDLLISFAEKIILHRELRKPEKWINRINDICALYFSMNLSKNLCKWHF